MRNISIPILGEGTLVYLVTSEQMQLFDKQTIEARCVPGIVLMENAGKEVALRVAEKKPKCVLVLCGKGNNGGDGWVVARWLKHLGITETSVVSTIEPELLTGDAHVMYRAAAASGVKFVLGIQTMRVAHPQSARFQYPQPVPNLHSMLQVSLLFRVFGMQT